MLEHGDRPSHAIADRSMLGLAHVVGEDFAVALHALLKKQGPRGRGCNASGPM